MYNKKLKHYKQNDLHERRIGIYLFQQGEREGPVACIKKKFEYKGHP